MRFTHRLLSCSSSSWCTCSAHVAQGASQAQHCAVLATRQRVDASLHQIPIAPIERALFRCVRQRFVTYGVEFQRLVVHTELHAHREGSATGTMWTRLPFALVGLSLRHCPHDGAAATAATWCVASAIAVASGSIAIRWHGCSSLMVP
jgi:hypothetical protein